MVRLFTVLTALAVVLSSGAHAQRTTFGYAGFGYSNRPTTPFPTPPSDAIVMTNLEKPGNGNPGAWNLCNVNTSCDAGGSGTSGSATLTYGITSPTPSGLCAGGSSTWTKFDNTGDSFNTLTYRHLGSTFAGGKTTGSISNIMLTWCFVLVPSAGHVVGYEWDPDLFVNHTYSYLSSIACYVTGGGTWNVWRSTPRKWLPTTSSCNLNTVGAGTTQHFARLWATYDQTNHKYTNQTLEIDGTLVWSPSSPVSCPIDTSSCPTANASTVDQGVSMNIQFQIDNGAGAGTNSELIKDYNLVAW